MAQRAAMGASRMTLDPFVTILVMYGFVMSGAICVLFWAFKDSFNLSGRLFLFSEVLRIPTIITIAVVHAAPDLKTGLAYFIGNSFFYASELTFVFSLHALPRNQGSRIYPKLLLVIFVLTALIEIVRLYDDFLPVQLYAIVLATISSSAIWVCMTTEDDQLRRAPFWRILTCIEATLLALALLRIVVQISGTALTPMRDGSQNLILLAVWLALLVFRYVCYQSIWMTWNAPHAEENRFNRTLLSSLRERDLLLQKLVASNRRASVSALASSLAHQLSQPLTGAALQAEAVKQKLIDSREGGDALPGVEKVTDILGHLLGVVRNLRSLFGARDDGFQELMLGPLCDEVIKLVQFSSKADGVTIAIKGRIAIPILGNPIQIQQVLVNLIDNAIEAGGNTSNRTIELEFSERPGRAALAVRDYGPGFSPEVLENLFDLFRTTRESGTGIGLWLCRQIVEKHKGTISAFNHLDGGACVRVEFPAAGIPT